MIDGQEGDICDFSVMNSKEPNFIGNIITSSDGNRTETCFGSQICYKTKHDSSIVNYIWKVPLGISVISGGGMRDSSICLEFNKIGRQKIELELELECDNFYFDEHFINIKDRQVFSEQLSLTLCSGELPFEINGLVIDSFGRTDFPLETLSRCDSIFSVFAAERIIIDTQRYFFCQGDTLLIDTASIFETGRHAFFYPEGSVFLCDSTAIVNVEVADTTPPRINCVVDTFINSLGIIWNDNPHVDFYKLELNDSIIFLTDRRSYLYQSDISEEIVNISVKPYSDFCIHQEGTLTCKTAKISTNIENLEEAHVEIFPNPSAGIFKILSRKPIEKIEVFDLSGRKILTKNASEIDLRDYPSGIYFFKIQTDAGAVLKKVFKQD